MRRQAGDDARQDAASDEAGRARALHAQAEQERRDAERVALASAVDQARAQQLAERERQRCTPMLVSGLVS